MPMSSYVCTTPAGLTRRPRGGDTARSLKSIGSTPAPLLRSRFFCAPISGGSRSCAGRTPSMGVSGIRKDPDAPIRVESTPTPFQVVTQSQKYWRPIMAKTHQPRFAGIPGALRQSPVSLRLSAYRALRLLAGPVFAHRLAFGFKEVSHG